MERWHRLGKCVTAFVQLEPRHKKSVDILTKSSGIFVKNMAILTKSAAIPAKSAGIRTKNMGILDKSAGALAIDMGIPEKSAGVFIESTAILVKSEGILTKSKGTPTLTPVILLILAIDSLLLTLRAALGSLSPLRSDSVQTLSRLLL